MATLAGIRGALVEEIVLFLLKNFDRSLLIPSHQEIPHSQYARLHVRKK